MNPVSIDILQKPAKHYRLEEKLINAASGLPIEELYNLLSGEKECLKKNFEVEKKKN